jgi:hypothetical protein
LDKGWPKMGKHEALPQKICIYIEETVFVCQRCIIFLKKVTVNLYICPNTCLDIGYSMCLWLRIQKNRVYLKSIFKRLECKAGHCS